MLCKQPSTKALDLKLTRRCALTAALLLPGCGFRPLYGTNRSTSGDTVYDLAMIDVALIPNRSGQLLRQSLQQRLYGSGDEATAKQYHLSVSLAVAGEAIGEQADSSVTRLRQFGSANWTLKKLDPAQTFVASGLARSLDGVNVIDDQFFAADIEGETVARRIADTLAEQITIQLATYFSHRNAIKPG